MNRITLILRRPQSIFSGDGCFPESFLYLLGILFHGFLGADHRFMNENFPWLAVAAAPDAELPAVTLCENIFPLP